MIRSFKDSGTEAIWNRQPSRKFQSVAQVALRKLRMLDAALSLVDLTVPPAADRHSIRINDQYRVCFVWQNGDAYDVEITDYH